MSDGADPGSFHPAAVHRSKKDLWLAVILWGSTVALVASAAAIVVVPMSAPTRLVLMLLLLASAVLCVAPLYTTVYRIEGEHLFVRSTPFRWTVPLADIHRVTPSRDLLAGPAMSLDRLRVERAGARAPLLISPRDKELFLTDLAAREPGLRRSGDALVRSRGSR